MSEIEEVKNALTLARSRAEEAGGYELFASTVTQLEYLLSVLQDGKKDRSRLKDIIVGHFAVHEFEESDPELAQVLKVAQSIAYNAAKIRR